ncbi:MAG: septum site-determining protein MinC [Buchnera aphidicola (Periphyllus acericola)]|uniref:septum site-determining protein MinC n=1 Tax=Buchnera aphidicola TaxID=9 RepID=UPI0030D1D37A|nr:septum site-determining protein MinC [Buchnera aphidicola (Periphyllus acericola)]
MPIQFKGSVFTTLVLYIKSNKLELIYHALKKKIKESKDFFKNAPIIINLSLCPKNINWNKIYKIILKKKFIIIGISDCFDLKLKKKIIKSGFPIFLKNKSLIQKKINVVKKFYKSIFYKNTIRSGQTIYAKKSDLIITNNVNVGAEIISDGNIHVYGKLQGRALAGANGDGTRKIFSKYLSSELLSIAGEYCLIDSIPKKILNKSAQIYLKNGIIQIKKI